jgi:hypothetical protein
MASTILVLSDLTADVDDFVNQMQNALVTKPTWIGNLTTQTSETLIELVSSVGAFAQGRIIREAEDAFSETAQADNAIRSITIMQGLRMARFLPASAPATLTSPVAVALPPMTQFSSAGNYFFNRDQIVLDSNVAQAVTLFEGQIFSYQLSGLGTDRQTFVGSQDGFVVSDRDVIVQVNGTILPKAYGGLWNYDGVPGYADLTLSDGRLLLQFGNSGGSSAQFGNLQQFGTIPQKNDVVTITYPVTKGASGNNLTTSGKPVSVTGFPLITGTFAANPEGGANDNPVIAYKNVAAGGFGTYQSAVTKSQYQATMATYPGIVDVVTQAQREINPNDLRWMNVVRVSGLTASPWSQQQVQDFLSYAQTVTMYAVYLLWQDPIPVPRDVDISVFVFNSAVPSQVESNVTTAIQNLFAPRPGLLMTNFYVSDLVEAAVESSAGQISYVIVNEPTGSMVVTAPESPEITYTIVPGGGSLGPLVYAYSISTTLTTGEVGVPTNWVFPQISTLGNTNAITLTWPAVFGAATYTVWGRDPDTSADLGILATVPATTLTFTDNGTIVPTGGPPTTVADYPIRYNSLNSLNVTVDYAARQQRIDTTNPTRLSNG